MVIGYFKYQKFLWIKLLKKNNRLDALNKLLNLFSNFHESLISGGAADIVVTTFVNSRTESAITRWRKSAYYD